MSLTVAPYDREVFMAIRALWAGTATDGQQKRAMEWIVLDLCHVGQLSFDATSDRVSALLEGERKIGLQLARMREPEGLKQLEKWEASKKRKTASTEARGENDRSEPSAG